LTALRLFFIYRSLLSLLAFSGDSICIDGDDDEKSRTYFRKEKKQSSSFLIKKAMRTFLS